MITNSISLDTTHGLLIKFIDIDDHFLLFRPVWHEILLMYYFPKHIDLDLSKCQAVPVIGVSLKVIQEYLLNL